MKAGKVTAKNDAGYIGPGIRIRGRFSGRGNLEIDGLIEGDIGIEGTVAVGEPGRVVGPIRARDVAVSGKLRGDVNARRVHVGERGRLDGNVFATEVALDDGGVLDGIVQMDFDLPGEREAP